MTTNETIDQEAQAQDDGDSIVQFVADRQIFAEINSEHCENGLLPDGPVCPKCGQTRLCQVV
jgi:hypothetical protein